MPTLAAQYADQFPVKREHVYLNHAGVGTIPVCAAEAANSVLQRQLLHGASDYAPWARGSFEMWASRMRFPHGHTSDATRIAFIGLLLLAAMAPALPAPMVVPVRPPGLNETEGVANGVHFRGYPASIPELDLPITEFMRKWNVPGFAIAQGCYGKLVWVRSYGWTYTGEDFRGHEWAEKSARADWQRLQGNTPLTIASVSKPITAAAVLLLVKSGQIDSLGDSFYDVLGVEPILDPPTHSAMDPRLRQVTIRQLLSHRSGLYGGWEGAIPERILRPLVENGDVRLENGRVHQVDMVRYHMRFPLAADPGTTDSYSDAEYLLLQALIEKVSGQSYDTFVQEHVFGPLGITSAFLPTSYRTEEERIEHGLWCYTWQENGTCPVLYMNPRTQVIGCQGASTRWAISAVDLLRFACCWRQLFDLTQPRDYALVDEALNSERGLGWAIGDRDYKGERRNYRHSGGYCSMVSDLMYDWADGDEHACIMNSAANGHAGELLWMARQAYIKYYWEKKSEIDKMDSLWPYYGFAR